MKNSFTIGLVSFASLTLISGCATTASDCDPANTNAGFGTNLACSFGGHYGERQQTLQSNLRQEQANQASLNYENQELERQKQAVQSNVKRNKAQLSKMQKSIDEMKRKTAGNAKLQKEVNSLEQQLKQLQNSGTSQTDAQKAAEAARLQKRLQQLRQQANQY